MRKAGIFVAALMWASQVYAGDAGSVYTMFGIGDLNYYPNARSAGMGYTGIGLPSANFINTLSPAAWSRITRVRFEVNGQYVGLNSAETDKSLYQAKGLFNGASMAIPISPANGIVFVAGFAPYSSVGYNTSFNGSQDSMDYSINEIGSGGITKAEAGFSYAPTEDLSFGWSVNFLFGDYLTQRALNPITSGYSGATYFIDKQNRSVNFTLGGMYTGLGNITDALRPLSVGFMVTTHSVLRMDTQNRVNFASEIDTFSTTTHSLDIPLAFGIGTAYQLSDKWLFAADYYSQAWGSSQYDGQPLLNIRNSHRFGIGAEKIPVKIPERWLDKVSYRFGFSYNATYYQIFGQPINEWSATAGLTMPVSGENRLNIGVEYAQRGVKKGDLVKDNIIRISMSLNISDFEPWFIKRDQD